MNQTAIFWPMLLQVLLIYVVYLVLAVRRYGAVRNGDARGRDFKVRGSEPERSATAVASVSNQFELPVLFFAVCLSLYVTNGANLLTVILAWLFVLTRYAHAWVHLTSNSIGWRSRLFQLGCVILAVMWIWFALHIAGLL